VPGPRREAGCLHLGLAVIEQSSEAPPMSIPLLRRALLAALLCLGAAGTALAASATRDTVLVAGGTGGTGRQVVAQLLAHGSYSVRVMTRNPQAARTLLGAQVELVEGDVREPATLGPALAGVRYVVAAVGSNQRRDPSNNPEAVDYGGTRNLAQAAKAAGVQQLVLVSSQGVTNVREPLNQWLNNILVWKYLGEEALRKSGVPYTIVRPSGLNDQPGGQAVLFAQGDAATERGFIPRSDVAAVCVAALGRADALGKTFEITGDPTRPRQDLAAEFARLAVDPPPPPFPAR
jgi:uncharacterized protein YbjT (DUF2867 family)